MWANAERPELVCAMKRNQQHSHASDNVTTAGVGVRYKTILLNRSSAQCTLTQTLLLNCKTTVR
jgi:hypothetical protein